MKIELAAYSPRGCSVRKLTSRPPDMRISFVGCINRNKASTFKQYIGVSSFVPSAFVPSLGFKMLTGLESSSTSFNDGALWTTSICVRFLPPLTPWHCQLPTAFVLLAEETRPLFVWLVLMLSWCFSDVFKLWL